ncbi:MAG: glutamine synthetase, partial [Rhizobiaceae bacterium]
DGRGRFEPPFDAVENPYASDAVRLPTSLVGAIERFEASDFYKKAFGAEFVSYLTHIKRSEWDRYLTTISEWEQREYFSLF